MGFIVFLVFILGCQPEYPVPSQPLDLNSRERGELDETQRVKCRHILIQYKGALKTDPKLERSREEAYQDAYRLFIEIKAGADFAQIASIHSDDPSAGYGGELPTSSKGAMSAHFEEALYSLSVDEVSPPIETIFGWHIIQRQENIEGQFVHILVSHNEAREGKDQRTLKQARLRIEAAKMAIFKGADPTSVATEYSDGPAGSRGGSLGWISATDLHPVFEAAAFSVEAGQVSEIIQSPYGFHLFIRYK